MQSNRRQDLRARALTLALALAGLAPLAPGLVWAHESAHGAAHESGHHTGLPAAQEAARQHLLRKARAALDQGQPDAALIPLETAAGMSHSGDTEMLQLQMQLQRGQWRQAMAFAAHTAAAHRDDVDARRLHLWLLALSGQAEYARRRLDDQDGDLAVLLAALEGPGPVSASVPAPWPHGVAVPDAARPAATGLLIAGGQQAIAPAAAVKAPGGLWLRNGLGRASHARRAATPAALAALGLALLDVEPPLPPPVGAAPLQRAATAAFAGSPAGSVSMWRSDHAGPAWPLLQAGFLGRVDRASGLQGLGWTPGPTLAGGPVLDSAGRLVGLSMDDGAGGRRLLPVADLAVLNAWPTAPQKPPLTPDEVQEVALPWVAQLLR